MKQNILINTLTTFQSDDIYKWIRIDHLCELLPKMSKSTIESMLNRDKRIEYGGGKTKDGYRIKLNVLRELLKLGNGGITAGIPMKERVRLVADLRAGWLDEFAKIKANDPGSTIMGAARIISRMEIGGGRAPKTIRNVIGGVFEVKKKQDFGSQDVLNNMMTMRAK